MNKFCQFLADSLREEFEIEVDVFVPKKKKILHMSLMKPLVSYKFFKKIINFIKSYWYHRQKFYPVYFFVYPKLNQSLQWCFDYIIVGNNRYKSKKNMDNLLDRFFEQLEISLTQKFPRYAAKVSQVKGSFFTLIKKPRGIFLNDDLKYLCDKVQCISENIKKLLKILKNFVTVFSHTLSL